MERLTGTLAVIAISVAGLSTCQPSRASSAPSASLPHRSVHGPGDGDAPRPPPCPTRRSSRVPPRPFLARRLVRRQVAVACPVWRTMACHPAPARATTLGLRPRPQQPRTTPCAAGMFPLLRATATYGAIPEGGPSGAIRRPADAPLGAGSRGAGDPARVLGPPALTFQRAPWFLAGSTPAGRTAASDRHGHLPARRRDVREPVLGARAGRGDRVPLRPVRRAAASS